MTPSEEWIRVLIAGGALAVLGEALRGFVQRRKMKADVARTHVDTVDVNVRIAGDLRDEALDDWRRARDDLRELRQEFDQYRADADSRMAEMAAELRSERAEKEHVKQNAERIAAENEALKERVRHLENEVASLKANGGSHA